MAILDFIKKFAARFALPDEAHNFDLDTAAYHGQVDERDFHFSPHNRPRRYY
jgi:hypothetical protein